MTRISNHTNLEACQSCCSFDSKCRIASVLPYGFHLDFTDITCVTDAIVIDNDTESLRCSITVSHPPIPDHHRSSSFKHPQSVSLTNFVQVLPQSSCSSGEYSCDNGENCKDLHDGWCFVELMRNAIKQNFVSS